jgi:Protein of unknown function (DUF3093)
MDPATHQPRQAGPASPPSGYFERLRTPWWWYLAAVAVSMLLGLEFAVAISGWIAWVPFAILLPASLLMVWRLSSGSVSVDGAIVRAGDRTVPAADVEQAIDLSATELRRLVGRHSDPLAFTYIRSWVGPGVQLVLRPPEESQLADRRSTSRRLTGELADRRSTSRRLTGELPDAEQDDPPTERVPEPYWVVSTRHPDRLLAAIDAARPLNPAP